MQTKVSELEETILPPADVKKLQLRLQGSVAVQVNAGPLAYAQAFLNPKVINNFSVDRVEDLKDVFRYHHSVIQNQLFFNQICTKMEYFSYRDFIGVCHTALQLNARMISSDQKEYHNALKENYQKLCQDLGELLDESFQPLDDSVNNTQRNSMTLFNAISGTSNNSSTA